MPPNVLYFTPNLDDISHPAPSVSHYSTHTPSFIELFVDSLSPWSIARTLDPNSDSIMFVDYGAVSKICYVTIFESLLECQFSDDALGVSSSDGAVDKPWPTMAFHLRRRFNSR